MSYITFTIDGEDIVIDTNDIRGLINDGPSHTIIVFEDGPKLQVTEPFNSVHDRIIAAANGDSHEASEPYQ